MKNFCDRIYLLCGGNSYNDIRTNSCLDEFNRIGFQDIKLFNTEIIEDNLFKRSSKAHLSVMIDALDNNYENILICENDIRFLTNLDILNNYIQNIPNNYDIVWFDYIFGFKKSEIKRIHNIRKENIENLFIDVSNITNIYSSACYLVSKKMIIHILKNQLYNILNPDNYLYYRNDTIDIKNENMFKRYIPKYNLCIQKYFDKCLRNQYHMEYQEESLYQRYIDQGINLYDYCL